MATQGNTYQDTLPEGIDNIVLPHMPKTPSLLRASVKIFMMVGS